MYCTQYIPATYPHSFFSQLGHALFQAFPVADHERCCHGHETWECHRGFGLWADLVLNDGFHMGLMMMIWDLYGI